ncbi:MAG: DsrE family protein [Cellulosilyticaceae bacterium]
MYNKIVIINSEILGQGDGSVGRTLLGVFLRKTLASITKPDAIIFYNSAVKLLTHGSSYIDILQALEESGVELLACGTCVYKVCGQNSLLTGRITHMDEITDILLNANSVITL